MGLIRRQQDPRQTRGSQNIDHHQGGNTNADQSPYRHQRRARHGRSRAGASRSRPRSPKPDPSGRLSDASRPARSPPAACRWSRASRCFFKERGNKLGRTAPIELHTADTAGNPAQARTKTQELVERLNVHCIIGPLAAFEALAIDDYIRSSQTPILTVAGAEDMTQRKANPWLVRPSSTSAQTEPSARRLRRQGPQVQARGGDRRRLRLRPRMRRRLPARLRGQRRQGGAEAVHAAECAGLRHLHLAAQAEPRRRVHRHMPARMVSSSSSSFANTATRCRSSAASRRSTSRCCSRWATTHSARSRGNWYSAAARHSPATRSSSRGSSATTRSIRASMPRKPISAARCSSTR